MTLAQRVASGVNVLNAQVPGWEHKVNLDTLDIASTTHCVLTQVFGVPFHNAVEHLGGLGVIAELGAFAASTADNLRLTAEWKRVIRERLR